MQQTQEFYTGSQSSSSDGEDTAMAEPSRKRDAPSSPLSYSEDDEKNPPPLEEERPLPPTPKKQKVDAAAFFQNVVSDVGPAPSADDLKTNRLGTQCLGVVWSEVAPKSISTRANDGSVFDFCEVTVLLGKPAPGQGISYDEKNNKVLFRIPDPVEYDQAKKEKDAKGEKGYVKVSNFIEHTITAFRPYKITVAEKSLPGLRMCSVVRVEGLRCTSNIGKNNGKVYYKLSASNIMPVEAIGNNPAAQVEFLRRILRPEEMWYDEMPYTSEEDGKNGASWTGDTPVILPICPVDNPQGLAKTFHIDEDRGFYAATRILDDDKSEDFFFVPTHVREKYNQDLKAGKKPKQPKADHACLSDCEDLYICATWRIVIQQWDAKKYPAMAGALRDPERRQHYEINFRAYSGTGLGCLGVSHPTHWAVACHHIKRMDLGVVMGIENTIETSKVQANLNRNEIRKRAKEDGGPEDQILALGHNMRQLPTLFGRGVVLDVEGYLLKHALRCGPEVAAVLIGNRPGDYEEPLRQIKLPQCHGDEITYKYEGFGANKTKREVQKRLDADPDGLVCIQMTSKFNGNMRKLHAEYTRDGIYYVLLPVVIKGEIRRPESESDSPKGARIITPYAMEAAEWVAKIKGPEVQRLCTEGAMSPGNFAALEAEWAKADAQKEPSKHAAAKWMSYHRLVDWPKSTDGGEQPWLIYALEKRKNPEVEARRRRVIDECVRFWHEAPGGAYAQRRPGATVVNPTPDESDKALEAPIVSGDKSVMQDAF